MKRFFLQIIGFVKSLMSAVRRGDEKPAQSQGEIERLDRIRNPSKYLVRVNRKSKNDTALLK
jgi:hypothetical protein